MSEHLQMYLLKTGLGWGPGVVGGGMDGNKGSHVLIIVETGSWVSQVHYSVIFVYV